MSFEISKLIPQSEMEPKEKTLMSDMDEFHSRLDAIEANQHKMKQVLAKTYQNTKETNKSLQTIFNALVVAVEGVQGSIGHLTDKVDSVLNPKL